MFDGVIFDIDGTLTSTNELIFSTFNHVSKKYINRTFTNEEIIGMFGPPEDDILKDLVNVEEFENARLDYYKYYEDNHKEMADAYPGIIDCVKYLKEKNIPLFIYTGKGRETTRITLEQIGLGNEFLEILSGDDVENHKPSPEAINTIVDKYNIEREKTLMIGDSVHDYLAAKDAGVKIASVVWDCYAKEKVTTLNSDYLFHSVKDFKEFLVNTFTHQN